MTTGQLRRAPQWLPCVNARCRYEARVPDAYCCGGCANASAVGEGDYRSHSEACRRHGAPPYTWDPGPQLPGPSVLRGCLAVVAIVAVLAAVLLVGAALFGRGGL